MIAVQIFFTPHWLSYGKQTFIPTSSLVLIWQTHLYSSSLTCSLVANRFLFQFTPLVMTSRLLFLFTHLFHNDTHIFIPTGSLVNPIELRPKLHTILAFLSSIGLIVTNIFISPHPACFFTANKFYIPSHLYTS